MSWNIIELVLFGKSEIEKNGKENKVEINVWNDRIKMKFNMKLIFYPLSLIIKTTFINFTFIKIIEKKSIREMQ